MSVNADIKPEEVGQNTNEAGALQAIAHNTQALMKARETQSTTEKEIQVTHGQETKSKFDGYTNLEAKLSSRVGSTRKNLKAKGHAEGGVYSDLALESSAVGIAAKIAKTGFDVLSDMDPGKHGGKATMENFASGGKKAKSAIETKKSFGIASKGNLAGDTLRGDTGKTSTWSGVKNKTTSELNAKLTLEKAKNPKLEQAAGNAIKKVRDIGAVKEQALAKGIAPGGNMMQLALNQRVPKGPTHLDKKPVEEENSIWSTDTA